MSASGLDTPLERLRRARLLARDGEFGGAQELLAALNEAFPKDPRLWCERATMYLRSGEHKRALSAALKAVELGPRNPDSLSCLARVYLTRENLGEAQRTIERAITVAPKASAPHVVAAQIARARGDRTAAAAAISQALAFDSGNVAAREELGRIAQLRPNPITIAAAAEIFTQASKRFPELRVLRANVDHTLRYLLSLLAGMTVLGALIATVVLARGTDPRAGIGCWALVIGLCAYLGVFLGYASVSVRSRLWRLTWRRGGDFHGVAVAEALALVVLLATPPLPGKWQAVGTACAGLLASVAIVASGVPVIPTRLDYRRPVTQMTVMAAVVLLTISIVVATKCPIAGVLWALLFTVWVIFGAVEWVRRARLRS